MSGCGNCFCLFIVCSDFDNLLTACHLFHQLRKLIQIRYFTFKQSGKSLILILLLQIKSNIWFLLVAIEIMEGTRILKAFNLEELWTEWLSKSFDKTRIGRAIVSLRWSYYYIMWKLWIYYVLNLLECPLGSCSYYLYTYSSFWSESYLRIHLHCQSNHHTNFIVQFWKYFSALFQFLPFDVFQTCRRNTGTSWSQHTR